MLLMVLQMPLQILEILIGDIESMQVLKDASATAVMVLEQQTE